MKPKDQTRPYFIIEEIKTYQLIEMITVNGKPVSQHMGQPFKQQSEAILFMERIKDDRRNDGAE